MNLLFCILFLFEFCGARLCAQERYLAKQNKALTRAVDKLKAQNEKLQLKEGNAKRENAILERKLEDALKTRAPVEQDEGRIEELLEENEELRIERDQLKSEKGRFCNEYFGEINELSEKLEECNEENGGLKSQNEKVNEELEICAKKKEELNQQKRELRVERDELKAEKRKTRNEHLGEINELNAQNGKLKEENEELKRQLDASEASSTEIAPIKTSDAILVIPGGVAASYLMKKDGSTQIRARINAPKNNFAGSASYALVKGQLFIFGGSNKKKIAKLEGCGFEELSAQLNKKRDSYSAAISINGGSSALICFGWDDSKNSCEKFDGTRALPTFSATWSHSAGGLGIYQKQPATVGSYWPFPKHGKAETLFPTGWSALPDFPFAISFHSLVGLENESLLLLGGWDASNESQTGIWNLKNGRWRRIGELGEPSRSGSVFYFGRSFFYFDSSLIYRIDLDNKEELEKVEIIGYQPDHFIRPILLETSSDFCP